MSKYSCECFEPGEKQGYDVTAKIIQHIEVKVDEFGNLLGVYDENQDCVVPLEDVDNMIITETPRCGCCGELVEETLNKDEIDP